MMSVTPADETPETRFSRWKWQAYVWWRKGSKSPLADAKARGTGERRHKPSNAWPRFEGRL